MPLPHRSAPPTAGTWLLLCAFLFCLAARPGFSQAGATPVLNPANGHYYQRVPVPTGVTWRDAYFAASIRTHLGLPGHLATITSAGENQFILDTAGVGASSSEHWAGAFKQPEPPGGPADGWQWVTWAEVWNYTNWNGGEPNNAGGDEKYLILRSDGRWNDGGEGNLAGYVVEYEPPVPVPAGKIAFSPPRNYSVPAPGNLSSVDLDGDGFLDVLVGSPSRIAVFYGKGDGTFEESADYDFGPPEDGLPAQVLGIDVNGDTLRDLVFTITRAGQVGVGISLGGRSFAPMVRYRVGDWPLGLTAADFNSDGRPDLAVANDDSDNICVLLNQGSGTFGGITFYGASNGPSGIASADFNGDGRLDLTVANYIPGRVNVYLGDGTGRFAGAGVYSVGGPGSHTAWLTTDDFNGDRIPDLCVANTFDHRIQILLGIGNGTFAVQPDFFGNTYPHVLATADLDGDGDRDIATPNNGRDFFSVLLNDGRGVFSSPIAFPTGGINCRMVTVGDYNQDGRPDVATSTESSNCISVCLNRTPFPVPGAPSDLTAHGVSQTRIDLSWQDNSFSESGFVIERRTGGDPFVPIAAVGPNVTSYPDTGLSAGTTYFYRVRATSPSGDSPYSDEAAGATLPNPPAAPTDLTATVAGPHRIDLAWTDRSTDETGFRIERSVAGASFLPLVTVDANVTTYSDTGLQAGTRFTYRVLASNSGGDSAYSNEASATTPPNPPAAPTDLSATLAGARQIDLKWTDRSANEEEFRIERAVAGGPFAFHARVGANVTAFSDTGLAAGTLYAYRVLASNSGGDSGYSNEASATTLPNPPAAPTDLTATLAAPGQIDLKWTDRSANEAGFRIERSIAGGPFVLRASAGADATVFSDSALDGGVLYTYRVLAYNAGGDSGYSNEASATTLPGPPAAPGAPGISTLSESELRLTWLDQSANEDGFRVIRWEDGGATERLIATLPRNATEYRDGGLVANTLYRYSVRAFNSGGVSADAGPVTGLTLPAMPGSLAAVPRSPDRIDLTWQDRSPTPTGHELEFSLNSTDFLPLASVPAGMTSWTHATPDGNRTYWYRVRARNAAGPSGWTGAVSALSYPRTPLGLQVTAVNQSRVDLTWRDANALPAASEIERSEDGGHTFAPLGTAPAPGAAGGGVLFTDGSVGPGKTYHYRARSVNGTGPSPYTDAVQAVTPGPPGGPPSPPADLSATVLGGTIVLAWRDASSDETRFIIERQQPGESWTSLAETGANTQGYPDRSAPIGVQCRYRVRAANSFGISDPSNEATATIPAGGRLRVLPSRLNFGLIMARRTRRMRVTLTNLGSGPLAVSVGGADAPFRVVSGGGTFLLASRRSRILVVEYSPAARGSHTGRVPISSSDPAARTVNVSLSGRSR